MALHKQSEQIKHLLVKLAADDRLPLDMTQLDASIFDVIFSEEDLLDNECREDMLVGSLEGGSNYWYILCDYALEIIKKYQPENSPLSIAMWEAIEAGETIPIHDNDNPKEKLGEINLESIRKGEILMRSKSPAHFADIINENDDATTCDIWFQYCVLGDHIYG